MFDFFFENSFRVVIFVVPLLIILFVSSQLFTKPKLMYWGIAGVVLLIGWVVIERLVVTDREYLDQAIYFMSDCVQRNDVDGLLEYVSVNSKQTYRRVEKEFPDYQFRSCNIVRRNDLQIDDTKAPPTARIDFTVFVDLDATIRYGYNGPAQRNVVLEFEKESDGVWRVVNFEHYDPRDLIKRF
jgi:hypothetical protein